MAETVARRGGITVDPAGHPLGRGPRGGLVGEAAPRRLRHPDHPGPAPDRRRRAGADPQARPPGGVRRRGRSSRSAWSPRTTARGRPLHAGAPRDEPDPLDALPDTSTPRAAFERARQRAASAWLQSSTPTAGWSGILTRTAALRADALRARRSTTGGRLLRRRRGRRQRRREGQGRRPARRRHRLPRRRHRARPPGADARGPAGRARARPRTCRWRPATWSPPTASASWSRPAPTS